MSEYLRKINNDNQVNKNLNNIKTIIHKDRNERNQETTWFKGETSSTKNIKFKEDKMKQNQNNIKLS